MSPCKSSDSVLFGCRFNTPFDRVVNMYFDCILCVCIAGVDVVDCTQCSKGAAAATKATNESTIMELTLATPLWINTTALCECTTHSFCCTLTVGLQRLSLRLQRRAVPPQHLARPTTQQSSQTRQPTPPKHDQRLYARIRVALGPTVEDTIVVIIKQATSVQHMGTVLLTNGLPTKHVAHVEVGSK